jgi:O-antigen/teichoic acid export membrane protein
MSSLPDAPQAAPAAQQSAQGLVLKNTLLLVGAQVLGAPVSVAVNAVMARHLGPQEFGYIYLAGTFAAFGFLLVDWGQSGTLPAMVARDRTRAGVLFGSGIAWRWASAVVVYGLLAGLCRLLGYSVAFQAALALVVLGSTISTTTSACHDTIRGFERSDVAAYGLVGQQLLTALFVVPTLLLGGKLRATLTAQALAYSVVCFFVWRALRSMRIGALRVRRDTVRTLLKEGTPFLALSLVMAIQPMVDGLLLSKLATPEAVGWHAAARKLVGVLVFPAAALISALYPTLSRLHAEDFEAYKKNVGSALRTATVVVVPVALGCALYADLGIRIFSRQSFGPAEDNLRVLSLFVFLLYFSMTLGAALAAAGLQRPWAITQFACVAISAVVDPLLIPWFQRRTGNGSLGVAVATVLSEVLMVIVGFWLAPRGVLDRALMKGMGLAFVAGGAMTAVSWLLSRLSPFIAAPIAVGAYVGCLWLIGGLDKEQIKTMRGILARKPRRD